MMVGVEATAATPGPNHPVTTTSVAPASRSKGESISRHHDEPLLRRCVQAVDPRAVQCGVNSASPFVGNLPGAKASVLVSMARVVQ